MDKLKLILFNPKYNRGSLYGGGYFIFWIYIKYFGKPMYKASRRLGFNKFFSLMYANILGSLAHVGFFIWPTKNNALIFIASLVICSAFFYLANKMSAIERKFKN